jgi:hypothetical protein|tara:strand:- start:429 stop:551 length:123 start_codon:yes stop_codon:yes gene_type:complete
MIPDFFHVIETPMDMLVITIAVNGSLPTRKLRRSEGAESR